MKSTARPSPSTPEALSGAREISEDVFVLRSGAFALNSGVVFCARAGSDRTSVPTSESGTRVPGAAPGDAAALPALLVDPAYFPDDLDRIARFLGASGHRAARILLTHSDWDHVAGAASFPGASIIASSRYPARVAADGERIRRSLEEFDRRLYVARGAAFSIPPPDTLVGSPSDLVWEGPLAHFIPAGGHTTDGLMVLVRERRVLFAGDHLSDREIPFVEDSIGAYLDTLAAVRNLVRRGEVETLVPGHGEICGRQEIEERIEEDSDYLSRLLAWVRETRRIVETVEGLLERSDEIVFRKGAGNPDVHKEHRANVALAARSIGVR